MSIDLNPQLFTSLALSLQDKPLAGFPDHFFILDSETIKVNDKIGNPIKIGCVLVWKVENTYKAAFEVDDYVHFVTHQTQSDCGYANHQTLAYASVHIHLYSLSP